MVMRTWSHPDSNVEFTIEDMIKEDPRLMDMSGHLVTGFPHIITYSSVP